MSGWVAWRGNENFGSATVVLTCAISDSSGELRRAAGSTWINGERRSISHAWVRLAPSQLPRGRLGENAYDCCVRRALVLDPRAQPVLEIINGEAARSHGGCPNTTLRDAVASAPGIAPHRRWQRLLAFARRQSLDRTQSPGNIIRRSRCAFTEEGRE
jgi:hypothetical protein